MSDKARQKDAYSGWEYAWGCATSGFVLLRGKVMGCFLLNNMAGQGVTVVFPDTELLCQVGLLYH